MSVLFLKKNGTLISEGLRFSFCVFDKTVNLLNGENSVNDFF